MFHLLRGDQVCGILDVPRSKLLGVTTRKGLKVRAVFSSYLGDRSNTDTKTGCNFSSSLASLKVGKNIIDLLGR